MRDLFGGLTDRLVLTARDLLTVRVGAVSHQTTLAATGSGDAILTPDGWEQNWFSKVDASGKREVASISWERAGVSWHGMHSISASGSVHHRSMRATLTDQTIQIKDSAGRLVRLIEFGTAGALNPRETYEGVGVRDLWDVNKRVQIDAGSAPRWRRLVRSAVVPAPALGCATILDQAGRTTIRGSVGRYVGPRAARGRGVRAVSIPYRYDL